jgi:AraC family transcriptional regulator
VEPAIEVTIKQLEPTTVAFIEMKGPYAQISAAFGSLYHWIIERAYVPAGPPSGVYFSVPGQVPEEALAWELRSPVAGDIPASGPDARGVGVKKVAGGQVASTIHKGPFEQVGRTYEALGAWLAVNGFEMTGPPEEVYLTEPDKVPPEEYLTEIRFPVRRT